MINYHQNKKKGKNLFKIYFLIVFVLILVTPLGKFLGKISAGIFSGALHTKARAQEIIENTELSFLSKDELIQKIKIQQAEIDRLLVIEGLYTELQTDYTNISTLLGIKNENPNLVLAQVLSSPSQSVYDTLIINGAFVAGLNVFSQSGVPIGTIDKNLNNNTSNILFFSHSGRETEGFLGSDETPVTLVGKGSGNFIISLPREIEVVEGERIYIPGIKNAIGRVGFVEFDPRDPFQKVFVVSEQNIYKLEYVLVENAI